MRCDAISAKKSGDPGGTGMVVVEQAASPSSFSRVCCTHSLTPARLPECMVSLLVSLSVVVLPSRYPPDPSPPPPPASLSLSLSLCCCVLAAPLLLLVLVLVQLGSWKSLPNNISKYFLALTVVPHLERPKQASWLSILAWRAPLGSVLVGRHVEPDRGDERADEAVRGPPGGP